MSDRPHVPNRDRHAKIQLVVKNPNAQLKHEAFTAMARLLISAASRSRTTEGGQDEACR